MAPGVPFVPLAGVQLVAMAADLGLAVVALTPRWRRRSTPLVVMAGLLLALADAVTATDFGPGSSEALTWLRGIAHVALGVGLLTRALGGTRLVAGLQTATSTATAGAVVVPLGATPVPAAFATAGALLAAAATRQVRRLDTWWARLLAVGFVGLAVAAALEPAARHSGAAASALLVARAVGSVALLAALARVARGSLLAQVVGASLVGVLLMAIGAVAVGGVVASSVQEQQQQAVGRIAVSELSQLRSQTTSAGALAAVVAACPNDRSCADVLALFSPLPDDFTAKVLPNGQVVPIGTTQLTFSQRSSIAGLPLVQRTLRGSPDTRNGGGTLASFGTGEAVIGAAPITDDARHIVGAAIYGSRVRDRFAAAVHRRSQYDITVLVGDQVVGTNLNPRDAAVITAEARRLDVAGRSSLQDRAYTVPALGQRPTIAFTTITAPDDVLPLAVLAVSQRAGEALSAERRAFTEVFVTAVVVLLLVALVALLIGRRVVRPVRQLTVVASQVRRGDFSVRANLTTADEVGRLGRAIDSMTASLAQSTADLRSAAEEQQAISERLGAVLDSMTEALVVIEPDGVISQANPAAAALLGVPAEQACGLAAKEVLVIADAAGTTVALAPGREGEGVLTRRDGKAVPVAYSCAALGGRGQRGSVVVLRDTTRDREVERMKTEFLSNVSHELRTPLTPIRGYAEILRRPKGVSDEQRSSYLGTIADSALRMTRIVDLIVDVAAIDAGKVSWSPREVKVGAWVDERVELWRKRNPERADDLRRRVAARLPDVVVDPVWLGKAVDELLDNALKYTPVGTVVTLFAAAAPTGGGVRIGVKDHGPGLDPEALPELFSDFRQFDGSATRKVGGLGLGLSFVRRIADAQGLGLVVASTPRKGAEFALEVPAVGRRSARGTARAGAARSASGRTPGNRRRPR